MWLSDCARSNIPLPLIQGRRTIQGGANPPEGELLLLLPATSRHHQIHWNPGTKRKKHQRFRISLALASHKNNRPAMAERFELGFRRASDGRVSLLLDLLPSDANNYPQDTSLKVPFLPETFPSRATSVF
jgi:hypothetical protein